MNKQICFPLFILVYVTSFFLIFNVDISEERLLMIPQKQASDMIDNALKIRNLMYGKQCLESRNTTSGYIINERLSKKGICSVHLLPNIQTEKMRREIFKEHQWVFAPNSNCMMKSMMKLVLDEMMKRCIQNDMLPPFIIEQATSNMKSVTFDEVNSSKCPECCRKLAKILPFAQLVFC